MKSPLYVETNESEWEHKRVMMIHNKKINHINKQPRIPICDSQTLTKANELRYRSKLSNSLQKEREMEQSNQALLTKLDDISNGKYLCTTNIVNKTAGPRSLNYRIRKKFIEKLESDNLHMARKLVDATANLQMHKVLGDYDRHLNYLKQIGKMKNRRSRYEPEQCI